MKLRIAILSCAISMGAVFLSAQEKSKKAYMVADAHLDTQWNWDVQTTINEYVKNTLFQNLFLLSRYPDYVFNFEGGVKYAWMKEYYPEQYEEMKKYIKEGRWHISGSSWDAADALVPSPESFIRNITLGQTFYREEFGVESTDIFLPDCFGFGWTLPTIAAHCGLIGFSSQKLDWRVHPFYGNSKHPFTIGLWQGIDGSKIMLAHGYGYGQRYRDVDLSNSKELIELSGRTPLNIVYRYYGTGDTGGSPTIASVRSVEKGIKGEGPVKVISAASDQLYKDFMPYDKHPELPVFNGELLMDVHGSGCYTSEAAMKLYNRQNEQLARAAENAATAAEWLNVSPYPRQTLTDAWKRFIFHQFHDDLTGTSIPRAYEFSWNDELISLKQFAEVMTSSVGSIANIMETQVKGTPIILTNAQAYEVTDLVEIILDKSNKNVSYIVYNEKGEKVATQPVNSNDGKTHLLVQATVPASGYVVYDVREGGSNKTEPTISNVNSIENSVYKVTIDKNGDITSLIDKRSNKEMVKSGKVMRLALFTENKSYNWPAWEIIDKTLEKTPISITDDVKITFVENGILRKALCIEKRHENSSFKQYIRLYEGVRADRIDFYNEINWQTTNALLKAEFPLNITNSEATYDLGIGTVKRGNNTPTSYEVYSQQWADITDNDGSYGVSILNDCKYGWDKPDDNTIRLTLIHTPETNRGYAYQDHQDFGFHTFVYSIIGHSGILDIPQTVLKAETLNRPLIVFKTSKHPGSIGKSFSFLNSDNKNVVVKTVKKAETSDSYIIRVYETGGVAMQTATLSFAGEIVKAEEADGTEKSLKNAIFDGNKLHVSISPYSIRTYKVTLKKPESLASASKQSSLPLRYNRKCTTWNNFCNEGNFESGYTYAAELWPDTLAMGNVSFSLGKTDEPNGLACHGDTILLPNKNTYNRIYFLAAAIGDDVEGTFSAGKVEKTFTIPNYSGFIGQWGHTGHTEGFLKDADIAFVGTHRHSSEGNQAYEFTYMFRFVMDIPKGTTSIILPVNRNIVLFAATAVDDNNTSTSVASELFRTSNVAMTKSKIVRTNLLKGIVPIAWSGFINEHEAAKFATDGDERTKWCDVGGTPNYIDYDLGAEKEINGWHLVNAGQENPSYVTNTCFLQYRNSLAEEWQTLDRIEGNRKNDVQGRLEKSVSVRYIRLLITQPTQEYGGAARIYEFEVF